MLPDWIIALTVVAPLLCGDHHQAVGDIVCVCVLHYTQSNRFTLVCSQETTNMFPVVFCTLRHGTQSKGGSHLSVYKTTDHNNWQLSNCYQDLSGIFYCLLILAVSYESYCLRVVILFVAFAEVSSLFSAFALRLPNELIIITGSRGWFIRKMTGSTHPVLYK